MISEKVCQNIDNTLDLFMSSKFPYKPAKLVHFNRDINKPWYAECQIWDIEKDALVRRRFTGGINRYKTVSERLEVGHAMVDYLNEKLKAGYVAGKDITVVDPNNFRNLTIIEAFEMVLLKKKDTVRPETYKQYKTTIPKLQTWIKKKSMSKLKIGRLTQGMVNDFLDNLFTSGQISSNKTYNNYLGTIRTVLNPNYSLAY